MFNLSDIASQSLREYPISAYLADVTSPTQTMNSSNAEHEPLLNEDEREDVAPPKRISKLNKILIAVIVGLIILMSVFVGKWGVSCQR